MKHIMLSLLAVVAGIFNLAHAADSSTVNPYTSETPAQHDARMKWFREARFGMFIHWGLYSQAAGEWDGKPTSGAGEWIMNDLRIPDSQYAKLVPQFNPVKFDAHEWVRIARNAGMKYIVITTKHHDGFAMYPSALTDWCIKSTPFQRDPLKELAAACKEEGITLCFYHSIMDWHHPDYLPRKPWNDLASPNADFEKYVAFLKGELNELLTNYGPIGLLWFDGNWENTWNYDRGADLYQYIRGIQPNLIVNNRVGQDRKGIAGTMSGQERIGDYGTPEQTIPANGFGPGADWETCMTMNDTWGFKKTDHNWKSTETLIRNLVDIASKGGNYLLNVGPTGEGLIPDASVERLREIGDWMRVNGEAIYDTTAGPFGKQLPWGRCTTKVEHGNTTLYLHVFEWPADGKLFVPGLQAKVKTAWLLANSSKRLKTKADPEGVTIFVPAEAPDKISSTVVLKIKGAPEVVTIPVNQNSDGSVTLLAKQANLHGSQIQYESDGTRDNIGYWFNPDDWVDWDFKLAHTGKFKIIAEVAAPAAAQFEVSLAGQTFHGTAPVTGSYSAYQAVSLDTVDLSGPAVMTAAFHPVKDGWQPINLKSIELKLVAP
jgi:alpha-L-fucosidase